MRGSHGTKPAVSPLPYRNYDELRRIATELLDYLKTPWEGDRIAEGGMRGLLTVIRFVLDATNGVDRTELLEGLGLIAEMEIESEDDTDVLSQAWLTADDIASRLRARLKELKYWWEP